MLVNMPDAPVFEKLTQALLEAVADDILVPGAEVIAIYSGFEAGKIDSVSHIHLEEHLGKLTARDLRQLETSVPARYAQDGRRSGRRNRTRRTRRQAGRHHVCHWRHAKSPAILPSRGIRPRAWAQASGKRSLRSQDSGSGQGDRSAGRRDCRLRRWQGRTGVPDRRRLSRQSDSVQRTGNTHWAGAAISRVTKAISVVVSETNGTVRLFINGEVMLRIEPFRRAMKWKDFDYEPPSMTSE